jgi:hypothetical protein
MGAADTDAELDEFIAAMLPGQQEVTWLNQIMQATMVHVHGPEAPMRVAMECNPAPSASNACPAVHNT